MGHRGAEDSRKVAERVRRACRQAVRTGYADAAAAGLCAEGALEAALGALDRLDLDEVLAAADDLPPTRGR